MSLKMCALASGSKGNCCFVSDGKTDVLIDLGISALRVEKCLKVLGVDPDRVVVLITHGHSDHVGGLKVFCKRHPAARIVCQHECYGQVAGAAYAEVTVATRSFTVGTLAVTALPVSHDVPCFGYIIGEREGSGSVAVVTDVGVLNADQLHALCSCKLVMLESNHDPAMLRANPNYSAMLKARILSCRGHLSNPDCAAVCAYLASNGVRDFILAHLSQENNTEDLALNEVKKQLADSGATDVRVSVAAQDRMSALFEVEG